MRHAQLAFNAGTTPELSRTTPSRARLHPGHNTRSRTGVITMKSVTNTGALNSSTSRSHPEELTHLADDVQSVLAVAAAGGRTVVLALVDGTRLNGVPLPASDLVRRDPPRAAHTVRLSEEAGTEPFIVRLEHVMYVRVLGPRR
jgi:hypothetical protein